MNYSNKNLLKGAAVAIFALSASVNAADAQQRERITLDDYCTQQKSILTTNPSHFAGFVANNTPFRANSSASAQFSSAHGPLSISVPAETFIPFCNPNLNEWTANDVRLIETGGTLAAMHGALGSYNAADPSNIQRLAELAARDISIESRYTAPLMNHMADRHGITLKDGGNDTPEFTALKRSAIDSLIIN